MLSGISMFACLLGLKHTVFSSPFSHPKFAGRECACCNIIRGHFIYSSGHGRDLHGWFISAMPLYRVQLHELFAYVRVDRFVGSVGLICWIRMLE